MRHELAIAIFLSGCVSSALAETISYVPKNPVAPFAISQRLDFQQFKPRYKRERQGDTYKIDYEIPMMAAINDGFPLVDLNPGYTETDNVVAINFKINNTTLETKYATSVDFVMTDSRTVEQDIPYINGDEQIPYLILGGNVGWANLDELTVKYAVVSMNECKQARLDSPVQLNSAQPKYSNLAGGAEEFSWNVDPELVPAQLRDQKRACAIGFLDYQVKGKAIRRMFLTSFLLRFPGVAAGVLASAFYSVEFIAGQKNRTYQLPISNSVPSMQPDFFVVRISADKSAFFQFKVLVHFTDGTVLDLGRVELNYFRAKGDWGTPRFALSESDLPASRDKLPISLYATQVPY